MLHPDYPVVLFTKADIAASLRREPTDEEVLDVVNVLGASSVMSDAFEASIAQVCGSKYPDNDKKVVNA